MCARFAHVSGFCEVTDGAVCVPDNAASWDAHPSASPGLSEVAPPIDSLSMSLPSSHLAPPTDPPHLPPLDVPREPMARDGRTARSKSPPKAQQPNPDPTGPGRRAASGGSGRLKKEGGRSTHTGQRGPPTTEGEGGTEGQGGKPQPSQSTRGRSQERSAGGRKAPHTNGNGRDDPERSGSRQVELEPGKPRPRDLEGHLGESWSSLTHRSSGGGGGGGVGGGGGGTAAGRKTTVSPGPWKIPGSDKLPSTLRAGTSTLSR